MIAVGRRRGSFLHPGNSLWRRDTAIIGLSSAEAFHGAVLLNQWCFSPYFPIFCWSRSPWGMEHSTPPCILLSYNDTFPDFQAESPVNSTLENRMYSSTAAGRSKRGSPKTDSFLPLQGAAEQDGFTLQGASLVRIVLHEPSGPLQCYSENPDHRLHLRK